MPLHDTRAVRDWALPTTPSDDIWQHVHLWIISLDQAPWRAPSAADESRTDRPNYEVRQAKIAEDSVMVEYLHTYSTDRVDLLAVTQLEL
ncbi:MAG: hypothetical protein M0Z30_07800 [Actinomycetota bacterium]|nr:hypothetical protein [Actinomycetota bacterium]